MLECARREPRIYGNHIRPQNELVPEGAEVFRMEDGYGRLIDWLDQVTASRRPDLSVNHLLKRDRGHIELNRETVNAVVRFYRRDYELFGYEKPSIELLPRDAFSVLRRATAGVISIAVVYRQRRKWLARSRQ
jgi:hypothetical protein